MSEGASYRFDEFRLDLREGSLRRGKTALELRPKSFELLVYMAANAGRLITKDELLSALWPKVIVTENSLVQCIKDVRLALGDDQQALIKSVPKRGYIFTAAVSRDAGTAEAGVPPPKPHAGKISALWKLPALLVSALLLIGVLAFAYFRVVDPGTPGESKHRLAIAVLPFGTSDGADDYFSSGFSEDLSAELGHFPGLAVTSPKVTARFSEAGVSPDDLRRHLGVRYLVEGSVRRSADRLRIAVRLSDLEQQVLVWSDSYDEASRDVFKIQDRMVIRIAGALSAKLSSIERSRAEARSNGSTEAYDLVLRGRALLRRLDRAGYSKARALFEQAIALQPNGAAAYVWLGRVDLTSVALGWTSAPKPALERVVELARKAISIDEFDPAAHVLLGRAYVRLGNYDAAIGELKRAISLNRSDPDSYAGLGDALLWTGRLHDAIDALKTSLSMDPQLSGEDLFSLGAAYFLDGQTGNAITTLKRVVDRLEANVFIYALLAASYAEDGHQREAERAAAQVRKLDPFFQSSRFGSLFRVTDQREKLAKALKLAGL